MYNYHEATISVLPKNFEAVNSEFDDYNSAAPGFGESFPLCFSSNRRSSGGEFDIIYKPIYIYFSKETGELTVEEIKNSNSDYLINSAEIDKVLRKTNSSSNELGPYMTENFHSSGKLLLLFANDESGDFDIKFIHDLNNQDYDSIYNVPILNSPFDDYYPTFNKDSSQIYWCSNRNGQFDIFNVELDNSHDLVDKLNDQSDKSIRKIDALNSSANDKCPFIIKDFMVFASDRAGGFGGFDLYYSENINGEWTEPQNLGSRINSEHDEYRPIIHPMGPDFTNDFMIFSSNRPVGLGGFDLYYVGIDKVDP
tara:strand:- start:600434 stop:601363 length:930 start_codon:yes stop_codon:yes gene_type:complete